MYVGVDAVQAKAVDNQYELTLTRPIGLLLQETEGGRVQVAGFSEIAPRLVQYAIKVGDYVVAVDSSVGDRMWPVSTVEGVISACTSRLPGQSITMRFERPESDLTSVAALRDTARAGVVARKETVLDGVLSTPSVSATAADRIAMDSSNKQLLSRCRDVLKRYVKEDENNLLFVQSKFRGKYALPALVADKVVDSLASAKAVVDCTTLSMIMDAYLSCRRPDRALWVFEAATGFGADASVSLWETSRRAGRVEKAFQPNDGALDLITGTMLLKAHAMRGDAHSVARVLAALEGRSGTVIGGLEVAPWPWTGTYGSIKLDTKCYNIAMAAFESIGGEFALKQAMQVFDRLAESSSPTSGSPGKDVVSYNTMISILANEGRSEEALALFERMKRSGTALRPDKFTYTSLIKAVSNQDDIQELLYDMRERGVEPDCVTYNTMIKSLCESKRWTQATRLVTEMESRGIVPDSMTYGYLMSSMLKTGKANACLALFESACASPRTSALTENVYLYTTAITAASMLGDYERALELVARMNAVGIRPNMVTLTAVMGACLSSGRADLASQIFHRMEGPDGYAMAQGVQAMCASGEADSALELLQKQQRGALAVMSGKDIMRSYHAVIKSSLDRCDFDTARAAAADLFSKGYIPSRSIVMAVTEMLRVTSGDDAGSKDDDRQRFLFVLYLVDSTIGRKLPVDSRLYTGLLAFAARKGGMIRKVASLMAGAKTSVGSTTSKLLLSVTGDDEDEGIPSSGSAPAIIPSWEALCIGYESYMEVLKENASSLAMPALPVRATSRDFPRVLRAEQLVTSSRGTASSLSSKLPRRRSLAGSRQ
jgi:pentatricopeptide repeat protein